MGRSADSIQAEIDQLESVLSSAIGTANNLQDGPTSRGIDRAALERRLDVLYQRIDRINGTSPMFVRGRVKGIGHGRV